MLTFVLRWQVHLHATAGKVHSTRESIVVALECFMPRVVDGRCAVLQGIWFY